MIILEERELSEDGDAVPLELAGVGVSLEPGLDEIKGKLDHNARYTYIHTGDRSLTLLTTYVALKYIYKKLKKRSIMNSLISNQPGSQQDPFG